MTASRHNRARSAPAGGAALFSGDFHQSIASLDQITGRGESLVKDLLQPRLAGIAASEPSEPDDSRGRAEAQLQINKVTILGNDDSPGIRGSR
jgi:hypothetical protein